MKIYVKILAYHLNIKATLVADASTALNAKNVIMTIKILALFA